MVAEIAELARSGHPGAFARAYPASGIGCAPNARTVHRRAAAGNLAFGDGVARLCLKNDDTHARGDRRVCDLHLCLRHFGCEEPKGRNGVDPASRRSPIRARARLSLVHRRLLRFTLSRQHPWTRIRRHFRDFHQPSLEYDFQLFSGIAHRSARPRRGQPRLQIFRLAAVLAR